MRFSGIVPLLCFAVGTVANQYEYDPSNSTIFQLSSDSYFAFLLEETLALAAAEGSSTGEVLRMATQINPLDLESWYHTYYNFAEKVEALAESIDTKIDPVAAREAHFRAATYYRESVLLLVGNASDPRLYSVWPKALGNFEKAIALLQPAPGVALTLKAENSSIGPFDIPAYFFKASACNTRLPTVLIGSGYDGPQEAMYHLGCAEILKRGLNCMLYEGPGQPTARRQGHGFITDWNSVVTPIVDYLYTRPDVDITRLVLLGDSFGGLLAPLAAAKEHRFSAMVLLDGLPNFRQDLEQLFPSDLIALFNQSKEAEFNKYVEESLQSTNFGLGYFFIWSYSFWSLKETQPYAAWKRLGDFFWNAESAAEIGDIPVFVAKGQDDNTTLNEPELARQFLENDRPNGKNLTHYYEFPTSWGAGEHTSLGAESLVYTKIMDWLSEVWGGYSFGNGY